MQIILALLALQISLEATDNVPAGLRCLRAAYPEYVCNVTATTLTLCDGTVFPWDDGQRNKSPEDALERPDLEEMMANRYRPGRDFDVPPPWFEPGRRRLEPFFGAMYGSSAKAVGRNLVEVQWMPNSGGRAVRVNGVNGAAAALKRVSDELERTLPKDLKTIAATTAGVFNWRKVRRSKRQSPHSWGTAIDIGVKWADYWDWTKPDADGGYRWRNRFPLEIVEIFEKHGFIWGGKWYHFDTMHFEYRPDLLMTPCVDGPSPLHAAP